MLWCWYRCAIGFCFGGGGHRGYGVVWCGGGPVQIACSGVKLNDGSTQLVATVVNERSHQPAVHLAIIQACFSSSSRVLLVSNLRRSNWKCTVKRFFKSTVMLWWIVHAGAISHILVHTCGSYSWSKSLMQFMIFVCLTFVLCDRMLCVFVTI